MGQSKSVTVGYRYYLGLHFGLCHGPVDAIEQIQVGDRMAWQGNHTALTGTISINSPNLFGGDSKEGGIQGELDVMMGDGTQLANTYLTTQQGNPQPAYRGILGLVYKGGLISANNPYVKPWAFRVRRITRGWSIGAAWYSTKASINVGSGITAANPAHIIYECLTNTSWGMGYPQQLIDDDSFRAAADIFHGEGMGLCIAWSQQDSLDNFVQLVLDHAGAVLSQDSGGGYFKLNALRGNYTPSNLELFSDSNGKIVTLEKIERTTYTENINEIAIQYTDATTGRTGSVYVQNLANVQSQGAVVNQTRQYPGIPTASLALRVGMRDLKATTSGLARITFVANRSAYALVPGNVIRFAWQPAGIASMSLRITRIDYGPLTSGLIKVEGIEDVFGLPATVYAAPPPIAWTPPNYTATAASHTQIAEGTYRDLSALLGPAIDQVGPNEGLIGAVATRPTTAVSFNYLLQTRSGTAAYQDRVLGDWAPTGLLASSITKTTTAITLTSSLDVDEIQLPSLAFIGTGDSAEIVQITARNGLALTVKRGCVDTVAKDWPAGTRLTSYELHAAYDEVEYTLNEVVSARFITKTATDSLAEGSAPVATVTMQQRAYRPYPPGLVKFNTLDWPASLQGAVQVTWAHRDRIFQSDKVFDQLELSTGPEPGTIYRVQAWNIDTNPITSILDTTTNQASYVFSYSFPARLRLNLSSVRDAVQSWQSQSHEFNYTPLTLDWTPSLITGDLAQWYDAADTNSVVLTNNAVSQWSDKSGNNRHAVQATASLMPAYNAGFNGTAVSLSFSNDALWAPFPQLSGFALFIAFQRSAGTGLLFDIRNTASLNAVISDNTTNGFSSFLRNDANSGIAGTATTATTTATVSAWVLSTSGTTLSLQRFINGTPIAATTRATPITLNRLSLGANGRTDTSNPFSGRIAEVVVINKTPSPQQRAQVEGYLAWKWGTVASLPADHPFKNQPPPAQITSSANDATSNATLSAACTVTTQ